MKIIGRFITLCVLLFAPLYSHAEFVFDEDAYQRRALESRLQQLQDIMKLAERGTGAGSDAYNAYMAYLARTRQGGFDPATRMRSASLALENNARGLRDEIASLQNQLGGETRDTKESAAPPPAEGRNALGGMPPPMHSEPPKAGSRESVQATQAFQADSFVVQNLDSAQMKSILESLGYSDVIIDSHDDIVLKMSGYNVTVFLRGGNYTRVTYKASFTGYQQATLQRVNNWNRTKLFTKTYLTDGGSVVLELDVDLDGGVTVARIKDSAKTFDSSLRAFAREVLQ
jgi:hypothetical protein